MALSTAQKEALAKILGSTVPIKAIEDAEAAGDALGVISGQAANVADLAFVYTTNDPSITPDASITFADGAAPTVAELLEAVEELAAEIAAVKAAMIAAGNMAA